MSKSLQQWFVVAKMLTELSSQQIIELQVQRSNSDTEPSEDNNNNYNDRLTAFDPGQPG